MNYFNIPESAFEEFFNYHGCKAKNFDVIELDILGEKYYYLYNKNKKVLTIDDTHKESVYLSDSKFIFTQNVPIVLCDKEVKLNIIHIDTINFISYWSKYIKPVGNHIFSITFDTEDVILIQDQFHISVIWNNKKIATFAYSYFTTKQGGFIIHTNDISNATGTIKKIETFIGDNHE